MTDDDRAIAQLRDDLLLEADSRHAVGRRAAKHLRALDSLLAERERMRVAIVELQEMAAGKHRQARLLHDDYLDHAARGHTREELEVDYWTIAYAQIEAALLYALVRRALGVEPSSEPRETR